MYQHTLGSLITIEFILPVILSFLFSEIMLQLMAVPFISLSTYQMQWSTNGWFLVIIFWGLVVMSIMGLDEVLTIISHEGE